MSVTFTLPEEVNTSHQPRYVLMDKVWGVYLGQFRGKHRWSSADTDLRSAPTYTHEQCAAVTAELDGRYSAINLNLEAHEVVPDCPDNRASSERCNSAGLPAWGKHG
jgi:hypothetical protein